MRIFIDEGHNFSGKDTGAEGHGLKEQDVTFLVGQKLGELLNNKGVLVKHSRNKITDVVGVTLPASIGARYIMANTWKADYFISLHCDSSTSSSARGSHICVNTKGSVPERLGQSVQNELLKLGLEGRSQQIVERKDLGVLKYSKMPAILVEMGFISNKENSDIQANKQDELAFAIYKGICGFLEINIDDKVIEEEIEMIYNYVDENLPEWARPTIQKLIDKGLLKGNENGELGLNDTMLKIFVINDRAGLY